MRDEARKLRRDAIEASAYALLEEKGYDGTSMLAIAKAAKASNETLYRWYGDKTGLFRALVSRNAEDLRADLATTAEKDAALGETLARVGPALLGMLVGPRAVALNRAAAADPSGTLGRALAEAGRGSVAPLLERIMARAVAAGTLAGRPSEIAETYLALLVGDLQVRRVTRALPPPEPSAINARAAAALAALCRLYAPGAADPLFTRADAPPTSDP